MIIKVPSGKTETTKNKTSSLVNTINKNTIFQPVVLVYWSASLLIQWSLINMCRKSMENMSSPIVVHPAYQLPSGRHQVPNLHVSPPKKKRELLRGQLFWGELSFLIYYVKCLFWTNKKTHTKTICWDFFAVYPIQSPPSEDPSPNLRNPHHRRSDLLKIKRPCNDSPYGLWLLHDPNFHYLVPHRPLVAPFLWKPEWNEGDFAPWKSLSCQEKSRCQDYRIPLCWWSSNLYV